MAGPTRRNYFINRKLQGRLIFGYFLFVASACLLFFALLTFFTTSPQTIPGVSSSTKPASFALAYHSLREYWPFLVGGALTLLFAAVVVTHRIAGPLFRFEQTLQNMKNGILDDKIQLRPRDEGQELAKRINNFNEELTKNLRTVHNHSEGIADLTENLRHKIDSFDGEEKEELSSLLWSLEEKNKKLQAVCAHYRMVTK